jgi:hypothetical protein
VQYITKQEEKNMSEEQEKHGNVASAESKEAKAIEARDLITRALIAKLDELMADFMEENRVGSNLTGTDRRRLVGVGVRNYGFIDKSA